MVWDVPTDADDKGQEFDPTGGGDFNRINQPGIYHVQVTAVDEAGGSTGDNLVIDYEVLGGKPSGQEGRVFRDWFSPSMAARNRVLIWALACGITNEEEGKKAAASKKPLSLHPQHAIGRQLVLKIEQGTDQNDNPRLECNWGIFSTDNPEAKEVLNKGLLPTMSDSADDPFGTGGGRNANNGVAVDQGKESSAVKNDEFGDLFD